jgi:uncharacterized protein involved in type VI secretion and phage assembly
MANGTLELPADVLRSCHLAEVVSVQDPDRLSRVKIKLLTLDPTGSAEIWARVAVGFAGDARGAFFIPDVGDEVLVAFLCGDPRFPIVLGGLWNGAASPPETLGGDRVDRWTITGKAGTRIAIVEAASGQATITLSTPGGVTAELQEAAGGKIELTAAGNTITIDSQGIELQTSGRVSVNASQVQVSAGTVQVDAGMSSFSGIVRCDVLQATTVVATTYTPGAGNVW